MRYAAPRMRHRLRLEGLLSPASTAAVRAGLPADWPATARLLVATFADEDVPIGARFDRVVRVESAGELEVVRATLVAVTQQWGKPFANVPQGWKTFCLVDFPEGVPAMVAQLPTVDTWHQAPSSLVLCAATDDAGQRTR